MRKSINLIIALVVLTSLAAAQPSEAQTSPGLTPANPFYFTEQVVEDLEVGLAGLIGGENLKAKAIANNADERLAEAKKMKANNKTEEADKLVEKYQKQINRSKKVAENSRNPDTRVAIGEVEKRNTETLKQVKERTPGQAQKGLDKALNKSNKTVGAPDNRPSDNKSVIPESPGQSEQNTTGRPENVTEKAGNRSDKAENNTRDLVRNKGLDNQTKQESPADDVENASENVERTVEDQENETSSNTSENLNGSSEEVVNETDNLTGLN